MNHMQFPKLPQGLAFPRPPGMMQPGGFPRPPGMLQGGGMPGGMGGFPGGMPGGKGGFLRPPMPASTAVPDEVRERYKQLREDIIKMEAAATEAEKNGDESGAKFKMMLLGDMNDKLKDMEKEFPGLTAPEPILSPQAAAHQQFMQMHAAQPMTFTQQQALQFDQQKFMNGEMDYEVKEFQEKYGLQDRHAYLMNDQLKNRNDTYENDLWYMDEIMGRCGNAAQRADLLNMNVRWMVEGKFCGAYSPNPGVIKAAKKFKLDPPAACKLAFALESREDPDSDMDRISKHLERSNKPSSLVMMFLKTLKAGGVIEDHYKPVAIGSWLHKHEQQNAQNDKDKRQRDARDKRSRDRSPRRSRSRRGGKGGGRDDRGRRDDDRGRGRDDDRGRRDDRGGGRRDDRDRGGDRNSGRGEAGSSGQWQERGGGGGSWQGGGGGGEPEAKWK